MLRNYFTIALRNLWRNKVFSFINISGLSIGLACCLLIFLYTKDEISFDRFHEKKDRLYRITCKILEKEGEVRKFGLAAMAQGPAFKQEIPEIDEVVRVMERNFIIKRNNETFKESVTWADENFFSVFSFPLLHGNPKQVLSDLHSIVLTDDMAEKYFGTTHAVGKSLEVEINNKFETFIVSGIAKKSPQNSTIKFKFILPFKYEEKINPENGWLWLSYPTYLLINPNADIKTIEKKMAKVYAAKAQKEIAEERKHGFDATFIWGIQPFLQMHLDTEIQNTPQGSNPIYSYILSGIAAFILIIACINFVNLTVAQSLKRSKEIGVRKVVGGQRNQLISQFLGESFILCFIAFVLAIALAQLTLPVFNDLSNKELGLSYLLDYQLVAGFAALFVLTGFAAGFYPALVLSGFNPVQTLYNRIKISRKNYLAKSLVVVQFALATFLIITTMFIYAQFNYLTHKDLGYNDKDLLNLTVSWNGDKKITAVFKNEFSKIPGIKMAAPRMHGEWITGSRANGKDIDVKYEHVDENYLSTLQVPLVEGRNFSSDFPGDSTNSVLVNETYVKEAGWKGSAIGKKIDFLNGNESKMIIVGVVKDYHYESLKGKIKPQLFSTEPKLPFGKFIIRISPEAVPQTLTAIEKTYRALVPFHPIEYNFMEELNYKNYEAEAKWKQIITFAAIITIFISCIGLFGLTTLSTEQRTKEIGIRKVFGATVSQIVKLISQDFLKLVFIAFLLAIPLAWYASNQWLQNFAYRIELSWWVFALAGFSAIVIALFAVGFQAIKAAVANPAKSLRTE